jgi:4-nitrophenyl phosphatase
VLFTGTPFYPVADEEQPAAVVVGLDLAFDYAKLQAANRAIRGGARFVATNADATLPTENGLVPGAGSIVAAVGVASGQRPTVIGKPETPLLELAMQRLGVGPQAAVMIGDRLDTDVIAGVRAGMLSVLVLTGVSTATEIASAPAQPDLVFPDLVALAAALGDD